MNFKDIWIRCIEIVATDIRSQRFHSGDPVEDGGWEEYSREAERRIDAMSNLELLQLLERIQD